MAASTLRAPDTRLVRETVAAAVERNFAPGILLSGGLDTSIVAECAAPLGLRDAVTVLASPDAPDRAYARAVATRLRLRHHEVATDLRGVLYEVPFVCRVMRTFDPMEVRNSIVIARALREASWNDVREVMTGDGADELFAGYSFMWTKSDADLRAYVRRMSETMRFSSFPLGEALGVRVRAPFLDARVRDLALSSGKEEKVGEHEGTVVGKLALRRAFPSLEASWRRKDPIEAGSGSAAAPAYFRACMVDETFRKERARVLAEDGIRIRDREHLAYYEAFKLVFEDRPPPARDGSDPCPACRFQMPSPDSEFCVTCGQWPVPARSGQTTSSM